VFSCLAAISCKKQQTTVKMCWLSHTQSSSLVRLQYFVTGLPDVERDNNQPVRQTRSYNILLTKSTYIAKSGSILSSLSTEIRQVTTNSTNKSQNANNYTTYTTKTQTIGANMAVIALFTIQDKTKISKRKVLWVTFSGHSLQAQRSLDRLIHDLIRC